MYIQLILKIIHAERGQNVRIFTIKKARIEGCMMQANELMGYSIIIRIDHRRGNR